MSAPRHMVVAPYTSQVVARAREHGDAGWEVEKIRGLIEREFGRRPSWVTVKSWLDPEYADRRRRLCAGSHRRFKARKTGRRPIRNVSDEWKLDRIRELHLRRVSARAIGQVAAVWWGEELSLRQVRDRLGLESDRRPCAPVEVESNE